MSNNSGQGGNQGRQPRKNNPNIADMILGGLKTRSGKETTKWLSNLAKDAINEEIEKEAIDPQPGANDAAKNSIVGWVDKIFDHFAQYEFEFNRAVTGTDLTVSVERPDYSNPDHFKGRLSTREWTLVLRCKEGIVDGFIFPCDKLLAFSTNEKAFQRMLYMEPTLHGTEPCWIVSGNLVTFQQLPYFSKQLFGALIRVARGEASEQEEFVWNPPVPVPERRVEPEDAAEFDSSRTLDAGVRTVTPGTTAEQYRKVAAGAAQQEGQQSASEALRQPVVPFLQPAQGDAAAGASWGGTTAGASWGGTTAGAREDRSQVDRTLEEPLRAVDPRQPGALPAAPTRVEEPGGADPRRSLDGPIESLGSAGSPAAAARQPQESDRGAAGQVSLLEAFDLLLAAIDEELEQIARVGARAFEDKDMNLVEQTYKRTKKIKAIRDKLHGAVREWKDILTSED